MKCVSWVHSVGYMFDLATTIAYLWPIFLVAPLKGRSAPPRCYCFFFPLGCRFAFRRVSAR
eukprot:COSAG02_NODE_10407_length_1947_cov_1.637446_1_plen_61_part_00